MRELSTFELAQVLIHAATGERYGDGYIVTDLVTGYAEPGYGADDCVIVFGNWNPKRFAREAESTLTKSETLAPRLGEALSKIGAEIEWLDEWTTCAECYRALRTEADSYLWKMYGAFIEDAAGYVCADCMTKDLESYIAEFVNDSKTAVTWCKGSDLEAIGFVQWESHNPHLYESGWYEGQNDNPEVITNEIRREHENAEIVFLIDSTGQFDIHFSAYVRTDENEDA